MLTICFFPTGSLNTALAMVVISVRTVVYRLLFANPRPLVGWINAKEIAEFLGRSPATLKQRQNPTAPVRHTEAN